MLASVAAVVPSHALAASLRARTAQHTVVSPRHSAPVLLDDEAMEAGLRARAERRAALLKQTRENLQTQVVVDSRAEANWGEEYWMRDNVYKGIQEVAVTGAHRIVAAEPADAAAAATVANWAYRGKHAEDTKAWTGERHLLSGIRTTEKNVGALIARSVENGDADEVVLLAKREAATLGTVHVKRLAHDKAEIGLFSVDPDEQGLGIGSKLLDAAEAHARDKMGVSRASVWVISVRDDLIAWYERRRYTRTGGTAPFPVGEGVGEVLVPGPLEFVGLEKSL